MILQEIKKEDKLVPANFLRFYCIHFNENVQVSKEVKEGF